VNVMWNLDAGHSRGFELGRLGVASKEGWGETSREATRPQNVTLKEAAQNLKAFADS
jgi:hypothetical protein